jgi:hypothetical protein
MLSTSATYIMSMVALLCYFIYVINTHGTVGFLFSSAIFLIISAFVDHIEYVTIGLLIIGLTASIYLRQHPQKILDGFEDATPPDEEKEEEEEGEEEDEQTPGVHSQNNIENYETQNASTKAATTSASVSTPAAAPATDASTQPIDPQSVAPLVKDAMAQLKTSVANTKAAVQSSASSTAAPTENFQEPSAGLFQLGELPSEMKKGPFVDVATTMTKAMGSLQPDQIAAMTAESQSLLDTQKNLMGMLQTMSPILQDGRQLLDTFSNIFSGLGGIGGLPGKA